jgi:hypothetical protein
MLCMQPVRKSGVAKHRRRSSDHLRNSICVVDYTSRGDVSSRPGGEKPLKTADPRMTHQLERGGSTWFVEMDDMPSIRGPGEVVLLQRAACLHIKYENEQGQGICEPGEKRTFLSERMQ